MLLSAWRFMRGAAVSSPASGSAYTGPADAVAGGGLGLN
jgi:hypothetical protein